MSFTLRSLAEIPRATSIALAVVLCAAFAPPARANPVPQDVWDEWLRVPGRFLRAPSDENRRRLVRLLGNRNLDVFLQTPDTLALMLRNIETLVPLFVDAQSPPFMPDVRTQAWFRSVAPAHRAEMANALARWLAPGLDSLAPYHDEYFGPRVARDPCGLAYPRLEAAQRLADWDARETLPAMRELRRRLRSECAASARDTLALLRPLDDAITRLQHGPSLVPLTPDGHGGVRSSFNRAQLQSVTANSGGGHITTLEPAAGAALWKMVLAARETLYIAGGSVDVEFKISGTKPLQLRRGPEWGLLEIDQYPHPEVCLRDEKLYLRVLELCGDGWFPRSTIRAIGYRSRFRREHVVMTIDVGRAQIDGQYDFETDGTGKPFAVRFPAVGSDGDPPFRFWTASLESPREGRALVPNLGRDSCFVVFPGYAQRMVRIRATSTEDLRGRQRVVYLLKTARAWGEPLESAELEVDLPDWLGTPHFSLPMKRVAQSDQRSRYRFYAAPFAPDTDLVVTWGR